MSLAIEIVGPPNVGKSTLLSTLTRAMALAANYPSATIEPNADVVSLPGARLDKLAGLFHLTRVVSATVSFVNTTGIVRSTFQDEGLGNQFLANIREAGAICLVTCAFADPDVVYAEGRVDPKDDIETVTAEPVLVGVQTPEKQIPRLTREVTGKKTPREVLETAKTALELLEQGKVLPTHGTDLDPAILRDFGLITTRKFIYVFNTDDAGLADEAMQTELCNFVAPAEVIFLDAKFEAELMELEPEEVREVLEAFGQDKAGLDGLARIGFDALGPQTYLTTEEKEAHAWTIHKGRTAPQVVGVIHIDFKRDSIKTEIVSYSDLVEYGGLAEACTHGRVRTEGKNRVMVDGDVVEFRTRLTSKR